MGKLTILVLAGSLVAGGLAACSSASSGGCARAAGGVDAYAAVAMKGGGGGGGGHSGGGSGSGGKSGTSGGTSGRSGSGTTSGGKSAAGGSAGTAPRSFTAPLRPTAGVPEGYSGFRPYGGSAFGYYYRGAPYPWWYLPAGSGGARTGCLPSSSPPAGDGGGNF